MMRVVVGLLLLATMMATPGADAEPDPPPCYDRGPVVDGVVVQVWLTKSCQPKVVVNEPTCRVGELYICP